MKTLLFSTPRLFLSLLILCLGPNARAKTIERSEPQFESRAKILVRFVIEHPGAEDPLPVQVIRGNIMKAERDLLTSSGLAEAVAKSVGIERLIPIEKADQALLERAAAVVKRGLKIEIAEESNVITLAYRSPHRKLAQEALEKLVEEYFRIHLIQHRKSAARALEVLELDLDLARRDLRKLEMKIAELRKDPATPKEELTLSENRLAAANLKLRHVLETHDKARIDLALKPGRMPNLMVIQKPTDPRKVTR